MFKHILFGAAVLALLAACGGGGGGGPTVSAPADPPQAQPPPSRPPPTTSNPAHHLGTTRFTTHQPRVLEQIGAHHAYARGLSGQGVRIGIEDTIVDYTQRAEFGSRVRLRDADGASLAYSRPLGDLPSSDVAVCAANPSCQIWEGNSGGDDESLNYWVQQIVRQDGWPIRDDSVFVLDEHYPEDGSLEQLLRWSEVPTPYGMGAHGTIVASVAAGTNLGVAPEATIIPIATNLTDDQTADAVAQEALRRVVTSLSTADRRYLDEIVAQGLRDELENFDIINRSYGMRTYTLTIAQTVQEIEWLQAYLPRSLRASWQTDRPDSEKTIVVWAAGNHSDSVPGLGAALPYGIPELRGHTLAVVATDPQTGIIAGYSNRCGPVPQGWSTARYGRHYCLAAPGTVRGLAPNPNRPGRGDVKHGRETTGTSFAAPLVSGSLALLKEHFRGTRGNTQIVKRMIDTADRSGRYADLETYGAGHLDLGAALSPVGALSAGRSGHALSRSSFQAPAAFGSVARRAGSIELAAFDEQEFPFWVPLSALISEGAAGRSPIPRFEDVGKPALPAPGLEALNLHWAEMGGDGNASNGRRWVMGLGPTSASLAHRPLDDGWGYGFSFDDAGHLGAETSGAFGTDPRSGMVWTSRAFEHELRDGWTLTATGTAALSLPQYEKDAVFRASPSMMSAMTMRVGTESTGIVVEQPLRAESGTGRFRVENGRVENGKRLYEEFRVPLRPEGRELRMTLRHDFDALGGNVAMEVGGAVNAGHVQGEREANVGLAYRAAW